MATQTAVPPMLTSGTIADRIGVHRDAVNNAVRSRGIRPVGRAGHTYVYSPEAVEQIAEALGIQLADISE